MGKPEAVCISLGKTVALVQARMGSTRFPGKMLQLLGKHPILEWVLRRVSRAKCIDEVVLATSDRPIDDPLVELAKHLGTQVFRGSEADVLGRFAAAAEHSHADTVLRICADNPFVDPDELDRLVRKFSENFCDYACNHQDRLGSRYADGFGAEILSNHLLQQIAKVAKEPKHREHVTLYLWDHAEQFTLHPIHAPPKLAYPDMRFDVDTPFDLIQLRTLLLNGVNLTSGANQIIKHKRSTKCII